MPFRFLDPGPLIDRELELVAPDPKWIDAILRACAHPLSRGDERCDRTTRQSEWEFLRAAPRGRAMGDSHTRVPAYHFLMHLLPQYGPPVEIAGGLNLRVGDTRDIELYFGHVGYHVFPPARGRHYAARAVRLLFPLAIAHGFSRLWITCNPENVASKRTCERLGGELIDTVDLPLENVLYQRGDRKKLRYRIELENRLL